MDRLLERVEVLEQDRAAVSRSLRRWKCAAALAAVAAVGMLPLSAQSAPDGAPGLALRVAELEAALQGETAERKAADAQLQTALNTESTALEAQLTPLEEKLAKVSIQQIEGRYSIVIDGANVYIRNGSGATNGKPDDPLGTGGFVNGLGNLIVGYNEHREDDNFRYGSHNIVVGQGHNYSGIGGLVAGRFNTLAQSFASVTGGHNNTASGFVASVSGGENNTASGTAASVSGGPSNTASGKWSSVSGGALNTASGQSSSVSGGGGNKATGGDSAISGGLNNTAAGTWASVSGGDEGMAGGTASAVGGGWRRSVTGYGDWRAGGSFEDQ
jgi:hypothetical protein